MPFSNRRGKFMHWQLAVACPLFVPSGQALCLPYHFSASKLIFLPFHIELVPIGNHISSKWARAVKNKIFTSVKFNDYCWLCCSVNKFSESLNLLWAWPLYFCPVVSFFFFSSPNRNVRSLDVYHTSTHGANLECRSERWCTRLAGNAGCK